MLSVLLESRAARQRRVGGTVMSLLAHGAAVTAVVALTLPERGHVTLPPRITVTPVTFVTPPAVEPRLPPPDAARSAVTPSDPVPAPMLPRIAPPLITPHELPPIDLAAPTLEPDRIRIGGSRDFVPGVRSQPGIPLASGGVTDAAAVDRAPRLAGRAVEPTYPAALRSAGVEGRVLAEFVVDTLGRAELDGLRFSSSANQLFNQSVREALARYRFMPGMLAGRKVRTRVAIPFDFRLEGRPPR